MMLVLKQRDVTCNRFFHRTRECFLYASGMALKSTRHACMAPLDLFGLHNASDYD